MDPKLLVSASSSSSSPCFLQDLGYSAISAPVTPKHCVLTPSFTRRTLVYPRQPNFCQIVRKTMVKVLLQEDLPECAWPGARDPRVRLGEPDQGLLLHRPGGVQHLRLQVRHRRMQLWNYVQHFQLGCAVDPGTGLPAAVDRQLAEHASLQSVAHSAPHTSLDRTQYSATQTRSSNQLQRSDSMLVEPGRHPPCSNLLPLHPANRTRTAQSSHSHTPVRKRESDLRIQFFYFWPDCLDFPLSGPTCSVELCYSS